jgi:heptosyltransferase-3
MKQITRILIIVQRSNGDVFLSSPLIEALYTHYNAPRIDLLINDDTLGIAKTLSHIDRIHTYSYGWRDLPFQQRIKNEFNLLKSVYRKYDLSINLTASDRSVLYAITASSYSISAREGEYQKAWWKKIFLTQSYPFDSSQHILLNNLMPLQPLGIALPGIIVKASYNKESGRKIEQKLQRYRMTRFIIFHPSAQYDYKVYPEALRNRLLTMLNELKIPIVITGATSAIDLEIKRALPKLEYLYDFIGETTLDEYIALSDRSMGYIGMDTLNMHIAAAQEKPIFAVFGPTLPHMWSPWSNQTQSYAKESHPLQKYGNITLFQADMPCVACGLAGCDDRHGISECLYHIDPETIFKEVSKWLKKSV